MNSSQEVFIGSVRGFLHRPKDKNDDTLILTHGAGANCNSPLLVDLAEEFCVQGFTVLRYDLPFRQVRPHGPPPRGSAERDQQGLRVAIESMRPHTKGRLFFGGHSYGGRQVSILSAADPNLVDGLLLLSYPLHPPKKPSELRTVHFPEIRTPTLFVHGSRDGFGSIEEMAEAICLITARTELLPIEGSGHELMTKRNSNALSSTVVEAFRSFIK